MIDGEVTGSLQTAASLKVGETAKIHADLTAQSATNAGEVQGNVRVSDRLELLDGSRVHGDIEAQVLSVAAGAKINGRVSMEPGAVGVPTVAVGRGKKMKEEVVE